ncbi:cytochrome P450 [Actinomadura terrae]|uniref:cytochrome P450 n=1 Tax=Actinomadura terrae TaxID=604353 RepID=UPI001FA78511|nr:cytochrome P450 [Actinomadura terrae]
MAGHATTVNFLTNAVRTLLSEPGQLGLLQSGSVPWSVAVEHLLRLETPFLRFPMRYAVRDVVIDGVRVGKGEAVLACFASAGRDRERYGRQAERLEVSAEAAPHLTFGSGRHFCLGASLARLEAEVALSALFRAFPQMAPAAPLERLPGLRTALTVSTDTLPVLLGPRAAG